jgi:hypothetical protein
MKFSPLKAIATLLICGAVLALADYDATLIGDLDPARPAQSEDPKLAAAQSIRETRRATKNSFLAQHQSSGVHSNNFLATAMIQDGAVTSDKLATGSVTATTIVAGALASVSLGTNEFQKATSGFIKLQGGFIVQWTRGTNQVAEGEQVINWPQPFPNACLHAQVTAVPSQASLNVNSWYQLISVTASTVTPYHQGNSTGIGVAPWVIGIGW